MLPARPVSRIMNAPAREASGRSVPSLAALLAPLPLVALVALVTAPRGPVVRLPARERTTALVRELAAQRLEAAPDYVRWVDAPGGALASRRARPRALVRARRPGEAWDVYLIPDAAIARRRAARRRGRLRSDANVRRERGQAGGRGDTRSLDHRRRRAHLPDSSSPTSAVSLGRAARNGRVSLAHSALSRTCSGWASAKASACVRSSSIPPRTACRSRSRRIASSSSPMIIASPSRGTRAAASRESGTCAKTSTPSRAREIW